jgi:hypothetical protein
MKLYRRILLLTLLLPIASLLGYWAAETLPNGPIPFVLSFLAIVPNFTGLLLVNAFFPPCVANPADSFHMIAGIIVNWIIIAATLTLIWAATSLKRK